MKQSVHTMIEPSTQKKVCKQAKGMAKHLGLLAAEAGLTAPAPTGTAAHASRLTKPPPACLAPVEPPHLSRLLLPEKQKGSG